MSDGSNGKNSKATRALRNRVVRAIFASAESMGISDREMIEGLADQVFGRLDRVPTLPGMEDLATEIRRPVEDIEIRSIASEILAERGPEVHVPAVDKDEPAAVAPGKTRAKSRKKGPGQAEISENARAVLERRYLVKDAQGKVVESPEDMFRRVARSIAAADSLYDPKADLAAREEEFYQMMVALEFLPNSPTLMNAGLDNDLQYSACYVLPVEDSIEGIFETAKNLFPQ